MQDFCTKTKVVAMKYYTISIKNYQIIQGNYNFTKALD